MQTRTLKRIRTASRWAKGIFLLWFIGIPLLILAMTSLVPTTHHLEFHLRGTDSYGYSRWQELEIFKLGCYLLAAVWFYRVLTCFEQGKVFETTTLTYVRQFALIVIL